MDPIQQRRWKQDTAEMWACVAQEEKEEELRVAQDIDRSNMSREEMGAEAAEWAMVYAEEQEQALQAQRSAPCVGGGKPTTALQVLKSAAGYYVGRLYYDQEMNGWFPYSRESFGYWGMQTEAQAYCDALVLANEDDNDLPF